MKIRNLLCGIGLISTSVFASDPIHTNDGMTKFGYPK